METPDVEICTVRWLFCVAFAATLVAGEFFGVLANPTVKGIPNRSSGGFPDHCLYWTKLPLGFGAKPSVPPPQPPQILLVCDLVRSSLGTRARLPVPEWDLDRRYFGGDPLGNQI